MQTSKMSTKKQQKQQPTTQQIDFPNLHQVIKKKAANPNPRELNNNNNNNKYYNYCTTTTTST